MAGRGSTFLPSPVTATAWRLSHFVNSLYSQAFVVLGVITNVEVAFHCFDVSTVFSYSGTVNLTYAALL